MWGWVLCLKIFQENITKDYRKADEEEKKKKDLEAKKIAKELSLDDRIECMTEKDAFTTLKGHKDTNVIQMTFIGFLYFKSEKLRSLWTS